MTNAEARLLVGSGVSLLGISLINGFLIAAMPSVAAGAWVYRASTQRVR